MSAQLQAFTRDFFMTRHTLINTTILMLSSVLTALHASQPERLLCYGYGG